MAQANDTGKKQWLALPREGDVQNEILQMAGEEKTVTSIYLLEDQVK